MHREILRSEGVGVSLQAVGRRQAEEEADMERILQQAQATLMKNIPDLELTDQEKSRPSDITCIRPDEVDTPPSPRPGLSHNCHTAKFHWTVNKPPSTL